MSFAAIDVAVAGGTVRTMQAGEGPLLLFAHATGMCAAVYAELLAPLERRARVVAFDARGHGRTTLPADPAALAPDWTGYGEDLVALAAALGPRPRWLVGHSMGAAVAFEAAVRNPGLAEAVLLIDPAFVAFDRAAAWAAERDGGHPPPNPMSAQAAARRAEFPDRASLVERYRGRGVFAGWPDAALDAYAAHGTVDAGDAPDAGIRLACAPAWEAATYAAVSTTLGDSLAASTIPFALAAAARNSTVGDSDFAAFAAHPCCQAAARIAGSGHFLPVTHSRALVPWLQALVAGAFPDR